MRPVQSAFASSDTESRHLWWGRDFLLDAALAEGADAFITGEMHYHQYFGYEQRIQICVIGHYQSEQFTTEIFRDIILRECSGVKTCIAETCTNPILYL